MKISVIWWDLDGSPQTIDSLRSYLHAEGASPWSDVEGLHVKHWVVDPSANRWGAITVWDNEPGPGTPLPPQRATQLIGFEPTGRLSFDVDVTVQPAMITWRSA